MDQTQKGYIMIHSYDIFFLLMPFLALIYLIVSDICSRGLLIIYTTSVLIVITLSVALYEINAAQKSTIPHEGETNATTK
jgi:uncharacterized membrane protein YqjE